MWIVTLLACAADPVVSGVDPASVEPGATVVVTGENFAEGATVALSGPGGDVGLDSVVVKGVILAEGKVPDTVAPGTYDLKVTVDGRTGVRAGALEVVKLPDEVPCGGMYHANTQLSLAREVIVIDRFYQKGPRDGERETLRLPLDELTGVEYELVKMDDGTLCSVIFVRHKDGHRVMFDDDTEVDLKDRAYRMSRDIGKPITVTREDAADMGKPMEKN